MTGVSGKTGRRNARRVAGLLIGGLLAALSAGCTSNGTAGADGTPTAALAQPQQIPSKPVTFAPVIGAPAKVSTKLNELLIAQAQQKGVPVVPPKDAEYTIRGYLVAAPDPKGTKLSYIWDVSDKSNKRKRIQGDELIEGKKGGDPWTAVDEAAMQRVAAKALDEIAAWLPKGAPVPAPAAEASKAPASGEAAASAAPTTTSSFFSLFGSSSSSAADTASASTGSSAPATLSPGASATSSAAPATSGPVQVASLSNDAPASAPQAAPRSTASANGPILAAQTSQPEKAAEPTRAAAKPAAPAPAAATQTAAAQTDPVAVVPTVTGAPGDGSQSLTAAMRKQLQSAGIKLTERASGTNVYTVKGSVEMGAAADGQQPITIQWTVVDPSGKPLDKAVIQRNKVAQGSLDGPWGQIADMAAGEAAKSIAKLIATKPAG